MEKKRMPIGVNKTIIKRNHKKRLLKKVAEYLKSDTYMFAPLISSPASPPKITRSIIITGEEVKKPIKEEKKRMLQKVGEYLKSDSYMYASLIDPQPSLGTDVIIMSPPTGPTSNLKRVTTESPTRNATKESNQRTEEVTNVMLEKEFSKGYTSETGTLNQHTQGRQEMVKHMVIQNCRSSFMPGGVLGHHPRKFFVE